MLCDNCADADTEKRFSETALLKMDWNISQGNITHRQAGNLKSLFYSNGSFGLETLLL